MRKLPEKIYFINNLYTHIKVISNKVAFFKYKTQNQKYLNFLCIYLFFKS